MGAATLRLSTVQFLADSIDQLDLVLDQVALHRNFDRFGLMLMDNVVAPALHRRADAEHYDSLIAEYERQR